MCSLESCALCGLWGAMEEVSRSMLRWGYNSKLSMSSLSLTSSSRWCFWKQFELQSSSGKYLSRSSSMAESAGRAIFQPNRDLLGVYFLEFIAEHMACSSRKHLMNPGSSRSSMLGVCSFVQSDGEILMILTVAPPNSWLRNGESPGDPSLFLSLQYYL